MSKKAKAMNNLYRMGRLTIAALAKAVQDGIITAAEYKMICGSDYPMF